MGPSFGFGFLIKGSFGFILRKFQIKLFLVLNSITFGSKWPLIPTSKNGLFQNNNNNLFFLQV
jgi:hypothetical protein